MVDHRDLVKQTEGVSTYTVQAAKTHLSRLLHEVQDGAEVTIVRGTVAVARLVPVEAPAQRSFGTMQFEVPDDFDDALPDEELSQWE